MICAILTTGSAEKPIKAIAEQQTNMENENYVDESEKSVENLKDPLTELREPLTELTNSIKWYLTEHFKGVVGSIDSKEEGERLGNYINRKISEISKERNFDEAKSEMLYAYLLGYLSRIVDSYSFVVQKEYSERIRCLSI